MLRVKCCVRVWRPAMLVRYVNIALSGILLPGYRMLMLMREKRHVAAFGCYICDVGGDVLAVLYSRLRFIHMLVLL